VNLWQKQSVQTVLGVSDSVIRKNSQEVIREVSCDYVKPAKLPEQNGTRLDLSYYDKKLSIQAELAASRLRDSTKPSLVPKTERGRVCATLIQAEVVRTSWSESDR
jgi:hypothetical protein